MTLIIPPGFGQLVYRWNATGDPEEMVFTMGRDLSGAGGNFQAVVSSERDKFLTAWPAANQIDDYVFAGVTLYVGQDGTPPLVFESLSGRVGTNVGNALPQNCGLLITKRTNLGGRRGRGRMYLPPFGLDEASVDHTGRINAGALAGFQGRLDTWFGVDPSALYVLLHSTSEISPTPPPTPITSITVEAVIATQRRRLRR